MMPAQQNLIWIERAATASIKGDLSQIHPARLLYGFFRAHKTGLLVVTDGVVKLRFYLRDGALFPYHQGIFAEPEFARFLQGQNLITEEERLNYLKLSEHEKVGTVELLVKRRIVDRDLAKKAADLFFQKNVVVFFSWRHGGYLFYDHELPGTDVPPTPVQTLQRILEGVREKYNPGMIEQRLAKRLQTTLKLTAAPPAPLDLLLRNPADRQVVELIAAGATLERIMAESSLGPTDARALVFGLLTIDYCKFKPGIPRPERAPKEATLPHDPLQRLFRIAEVSLDRIRRELARQERSAAVREEEITVTEDEAHDEELRRRLLDHLHKYNEERTTRDDALSKADEAVGHRSPAAADLAEPRQPAAPLDEPAEELVAGPDAADVAPDDLGDVTLADLGEIPAKLDPAFTNFDEMAVSEKLLDDSREMLFSAEDPPEQIFQLAVSLFEQSMWAKAREMFEIALQRGYDAPEVKARLGIALYFETTTDPQRFRNAAAWIQKAITQQPKNSVGYLYMGKLYQTEGDLSMAELYFVRAVEADPECTEAKEIIRRLYLDRKK